MTVDPMSPVFRALSDPSRRLLLDRLFERDGQTLGELCGHLPEMTRFGVMRHLDVLEAAALVTTRREGREKRHYLNPVPIRLMHDRWISKYAEPVIGALSAMKRHLEAPVSTFEHVYSVYIQAAPDRVWRAITHGAETAQYKFGTRVDSTWEAGAPPTPTGRRPRPTARSSRSTRRTACDVVPRPLGSGYRGRRARRDGLCSAEGDATS
jgi:DNA-binding transcriptional ArsR family regulator